MQVSTKRRFMILLDEDEAEEFLDNPETVQTRVREQMRSNGTGNHATTAAAPARAPMARVQALPSPKAKRGRKPKGSLPKVSGNGRRPLKKTPCPECGKELPGHWLVRHRSKVHGVVPAVEIESVA